VSLLSTEIPSIPRERTGSQGALRSLLNEPDGTQKEKETDQPTHGKVKAIHKLKWKEQRNALLVESVTIAKAFELTCNH
jgi:hypothetical protein